MKSNIAKRHVALSDTKSNRESSAVSIAVRASIRATMRDRVRDRSDVATLVEQFCDVRFHAAQRGIELAQIHRDEPREKMITHAIRGL